MERRARAGLGDATGGAVAEFTLYFRSLVSAVGDTPGWYGVFAARDPEGVQAYLDGADVTPWDVLLAVLHDVAALHGRPVSGEGLALAERLYTAAVAELDAAPGAERTLRARLDAMQRERQYAMLHERDTARAVQQGTADPNDLAWARDDRERATARCLELQGRLDALPELPALPSAAQAPAPSLRVPAPRAEAAPAAVPAAQPDPEPEPEPARRTKRERSRGGARYGGARFAGAPETQTPGEAPTEPDAPAAPVARGARFAGAPAATGGRKEERRAAAEARVVQERQAHRVAAQQTAARLGELRRGGRSGEVYVLMSEAAAAPAEQLPLLASAMEQSGLAADVGTLLWEVAAQNPPRLAAAAAALAEAGRQDDCRTLLNQAAARPAADVALTAAALVDTGHRSEAVTLLVAVVRARTPEDAAEIVYERRELAGPLLDAAGLHSGSRRRDVAAALRRAGLPDREM
ncbi:hypothetical protein [Streptomyces sp. NBC_01262]|uniref:hypothetical protein n=1 Tax=Streptomyces sp. NBC_01262 TaxID=2903803 RepID=UPI002E3776BF|nr:hypothetical protein [Streptomyces sp. NBC_01262]